MLTLHVSAKALIWLSTVIAIRNRQIAPAVSTLRKHIIHMQYVHYHAVRFCHSFVSLCCFFFFFLNMGGTPAAVHGAEAPFNFVFFQTTLSRCHIIHVRSTYWHESMTEIEFIEFISEGAASVDSESSPHTQLWWRRDINCLRPRNSAPTIGERELERKYETVATCTE